MSYRKCQICLCGYVFLEPSMMDKTNPDGLGDEEFILVSRNADGSQIIACPKCGTLKLER